jgi:hypothetical protein
VQEYRAYTVGTDGHFIGFEPLVCADDGEAIDRAKRLVDGHDIELWNGPRFLMRLSVKKADAVTHEIKDGCLTPRK